MFTWLKKLHSKLGKMHLENELKDMQSASKQVGSHLNWDVDVFDVMMCARAVNHIIRQSADAGLLDNGMLATTDEMRNLHELRKHLAKFFNEDLIDFENPTFLLKKEIEGKEL